MIPMKLFLPLLLLFSFSLSAQQPLTPFESSGGTGTWQEVILYYEQLAATSDYVRITPQGITDSGKPLHLVTIDLTGNHDPQAAREAERTIILINNGIHPGEPDGIEASMMLARDLLEEEHRHLLENAFLAIIPVYNVGGALNRNATSRVNQDGPAEYGFRGNARNYDLNRDFIKADTRNARSFHAIYHHLKPDIFIDTHVSNGADYQYTITHLATQHDKIGGAMGEYIYQTFTPALEKKMTEKDFPITPYVNVFNRTPDERGFSQFLDNPRYSTGYTALFNTLGFMIETHMLKPFDQRVHATSAFLMSVLELAETDGARIRELHRKPTLPAPGDLHPLAWRLNQSRADTITFLGYEGRMIPSEVTGQSRLFYDRDKPFEKRLPYYTHFDPAATVEVPLAYVIPQGWHEIISLLRENDVELLPLPADTVINVEAYNIAGYTTSDQVYEGHYPHREVELENVMENVSFRQGDFIAYVNQPSGRYLIETLEPQATDSWFSWNYFDTILRQKEGFSPYVFEELAAELLAEDDALRIAFEEKKASDDEFAGNWYAQLNYIYEHSPYKEDAHMRYPVYRIMP